MCVESEEALVDLFDLRQELPRKFGVLLHGEQDRIADTLVGPTQQQVDIHGSRDARGLLVVDVVLDRQTHRDNAERAQTQQQSQGPSFSSPIHRSLRAPLPLRLASLCCGARVCCAADFPQVFGLARRHRRAAQVRAELSARAVDHRRGIEELDKRGRDEEERHRADRSVRQKAGPSAGIQPACRPAGSVTARAAQSLLALCLFGGSSHMNGVDCDPPCQHTHHHTIRARQPPAHRDRVDAF